MTEADLEQEAIARALDAIRAAGGRATAAKRLLLEVLSADSAHRTAEELTIALQARAPDVAPSTTYRILEELERVGLVDHSHAGKGPTTYHLRSAAHGHLVCERCDEMIEIDPSAFDQLVATAASSHGFVVDPHHFAVLGRCARCASSG